MRIELRKFKIEEIANGYVDNEQEGCFAYNKKLNIRPKYQREFVYKNEKRNEVIRTIQKNFPLNVMYWIKKSDGTFEVLDGQQRTISFCQYINNDFSINNMLYSNLTNDEKNKILNYELNVYVCEGTDQETLDWFKIINIAGEKLTDQELRNAIYTGEWLTDAKRYFSKKGCAAYEIGNDYIKGIVDRQEYLEVALDWITVKDTIESYMSNNQDNSDAKDLWNYFENVIKWTKRLFPKYHKEMKGLPWGIFYNNYCKNTYDSKKLEIEVNKLMEDEDVQKKLGIYEYLLSNKTKKEKLNLRAFSDKIKREVFEKQDGICIKCQEKFDIDDMEADHIKPWSNGGETIKENCQMLCKRCNGMKSNH